MAKEKTLSNTGFMHTIFQLGVYKRSQGRVTRQVTCAAIWVAVGLAAWRMSVWLEVSALNSLVNLFPSLESSVEGRSRPIAYLLSFAVLGIGLWTGFRVVNMPRFADFLIAVEAEMNKVSWPSRAELVRSSIVVIGVIFFLAVMLFGFDLIWQQLFQLLRIIPGETPSAG